MALKKNCDVFIEKRIGMESKFTTTALSNIHFLSAKSIRVQRRRKVVLYSLSACVCEVGTCTATTITTSSSNI